MHKILELLYHLIGSADEIVLQGIVKLDEVGGKTGDADNEIVIFIRLSLRFTQLVRTDNIVLYMHAAERKEGFYKRSELADALLTLYSRRMEFHI
jgi:hypothetical protein